MKKIYALMLAAAASSALSVGAQTQITDGDFEGEWVTCYPWDGDPQQTTKSVGTTPEGWCIANVLGLRSSTFGKVSYTSSKEVGLKAEGYNGSASAVKLLNQDLTIQVIPGYMAIGTTWNTSKMSLFSPVSGTKDGGSFGGAAFTGKPDAMTFAYKNAASSSNQSTALAYLWAGTFKQADVPIYVASSPATQEMTDRDRNILGIETETGGDVTEKGTLVAVINQRLDNAGDWTVATLDFEYKSDVAPEKINIAFAAGDYFSFSPVKDEEVTIDNVKLLYYHTLKGVTVEGAALDGFAADKYDYTLPADADFDNVECVALSPRATVAKSVEGNKLTVKVTNQGGEDAEGLTEHTYTFTKEESEDPTPAEKQIKTETLFPGTLDVSMSGNEIATGEAATVHMIEYTDGTTSVVLPDFEFSGLEIGTINVPVTVTAGADGATDYEGSVKGMKLAYSEEYQMYAIIADVDAKGTQTQDGKLTMTIDVNWDTEATDPSSEAGIVPIQVTFNGKKDSAAIKAIATDGVEAKAEYYNLQGVRVNGEMTPGVYVRIQSGKAVKLVVK
ncbi:MAG: calycin-like domain-containing protein [Candidatus Amulumruptor caecigallinarius]|nr:calycin-like domain-containing protein [Candidatus Amulumruptor caecigallinarius]MCM1396387.1 calycin-like domain-containing protein [Candidatus Amulumruptor caecigallinarius]MCM1453556.1 calycin-like domain-containing protein [bacterium]